MRPEGQELDEGGDPPVTRVKTWLVRRLTQPELGEVRRFGGADFTLQMIDHHLEVFDTHTVVLTYVKPYLNRGSYEVTDHRT